MSRMLIVVLVLAPVFSGRAQSPADGKPPILVVFEIENRESRLVADELRALGDYLAARLGEGGRYQIVAREEIKDQLRAQKKESYKACYDKSCQIEVGRELAAQFSVATNISRVGNTCLVSAVMYDLAKAATIRSATDKEKCDPEKLLATMDRLAGKLRGDAPGTTAAVQTPPAARPAPGTGPDLPILTDDEHRATPGERPPPDKIPDVSEYADRPTTRLSDWYLGAQFLIGPTAESITDAQEPNGDKSSDSEFGLELTVDWRPVGPLFVGACGRSHWADNYFYQDLSLRVGVLLKLSQSWRFVLYGLMGLSIRDREWMPDAHMAGWHAGGGLDFRYMIVKLFGIGAGMSVLYESNGRYDELSRDVLGTAAFAFHVGIVFGI